MTVRTMAEASMTADQALPVSRPLCRSLMTATKPWMVCVSS